MFKFNNKNLSARTIRIVLMHLLLSLNRSLTLKRENDSNLLKFKVRCAKGNPQQHYSVFLVKRKSFHAFLLMTLSICCSTGNKIQKL